MAPVLVFPCEAAVEGAVAERMYRRRWSADKLLILMARPERFERPTLRFVVVEAAHTRSCLIARMSAGMAGHETGDSASDRPIFTLLHAGVGTSIEKPFGQYHWQYNDWCSPDDALSADDTETTQVEAVKATQGSSVISQSEATQVTLCKY
jgi:hypothetical protein